MNKYHFRSFLYADQKLNMKYNGHVMSVSMCDFQNVLNRFRLIHKHQYQKLTRESDFESCLYNTTNILH
jgi:hypothetical protein